MRRHPVHDHADAGFVESVDEELEIVRRAEAARRRVEAGDLVTPTRIVSVLRHRQKLDVREAHLPHVFDQRPGQLTVAE